MAVTKEQFQPDALVVDSLPAVVSLVRNPSGDWSFQFRIDGSAQTPDGRVIRVDRHVKVRATEQIGRKRTVVVVA